MKQFIFTMVAFTLATCGYNPAFADAVIFSGSDVKTLKQNIDLFGVNKIMSGTVDPSSSATTANIGSLYLNSSNGNIYRKLDTGSSTNWQILGAGGSGTTNFIANGTAEAVTTGWATYADAAGTRPVDGTGGSPTVTWTRSTSSPLVGIGSFVFTKDAANRQGEGASYAFTIDSNYKARVLQISAEYLVGSGTFTAGSSSTDSDIIVYLYDVTNGVLIEPSSFKLYSNSSTTGAKFDSTFQTASNSTSYRLIFHAASTSASAYTVKFDNIEVKPSNYVYGTPVTDWSSFTPTGAFTTNTTYTGQWRRVGGNAEIEYTLVFAGAPNSVTSTLNLPAGFVIDTAKLGSSGNETFGYGSIWDNGVSIFDVAAMYKSTTDFYPYKKVASSADAFEAFITQATPFTIGSTDRMFVHISVPIVGWSSSVQMSDNADTRVIVLTASGDPASATSGNPIIFPTVGTDTHGAYSASTGRYTVPVAGFYRISGSIISASSATSLQIYKNAVSVGAIGNLDSNGEATFTGLVSCVAGDIIDLRPGGTVDATSSQYFVERISGPSAIAATETVAAIVSGDPASATSGNPIIVPTVGTDTHGAYNASTGRYTVPVAGIYKVYGSLVSASSATTLKIYKNAVSDAQAGNLDSNGEATFGAAVNCVAGDVIDIRPGGTVDATAMSLNFERIK